MALYAVFKRRRQVEVLHKHKETLPQTNLFADYDLKVVVFCLAHVMLAARVINPENVPKPASIAPSLWPS